MKSNKVAVTKTLDNSTYKHELVKKVYEELAEYEAASDDAQAVLELADMLEAIYALAKLHNSSEAQLEELRQQKKLERGGFDEKTFLIKVEEESGLDASQYNYNDLKSESLVFMRYRDLIDEIEKTKMIKSYKMVVLQVMLKRGKSDWFKPIKASEIARPFYEYYMATEYRKWIDFSDNTCQKLWEYKEDKIADLIERMPRTHWASSSPEFVVFEGESFSFKLDVTPADEQFLYNWVQQVCQYRLRDFFQKKRQEDDSCISHN